MLILNIAAGKFNPLPIYKENMLPNFILNVDTSYFSKYTPDEIESKIKQWENDPDRISKSYNLSMDIFKFMERTSIKFDHIVIYRFLEHISFTQVEYFIYLVSTVLNFGGLVDIIVPDYEILAKLILDENCKMTSSSNYNFHASNIELTTELLNEPSCPHASIWTQSRMKYFWELEKRFEISSQKSGFKFDGRDLYLRSIIKRI